MAKISLFPISFIQFAPETAVWHPRFDHSYKLHLRLRQGEETSAPFASPLPLPSPRQGRGEDEGEIPWRRGNLGGVR